MQLLWKEAQMYPFFSLLGEMEGHMFECVNQAAVHEELEDESRRLCDVRPFLPVLKLITRNCGRAERLLDSKIGVLIGKGKAHMLAYWGVLCFCEWIICLTKKFEWSV